MKEQLLNEVENIVIKGEIYHDEQFLLLKPCFQNLLLQRRQISSMCWRVNQLNSTCYVTGDTLLNGCENIWQLFKSHIKETF